MKLQGSITIYEAAALRQKFMEYLENTEELIVNLEDIQDCDTAGIQLLYSAITTSKRQGKLLIIENPPASIKDTVYRLGLDPGIFNIIDLEG